MKILILVTFFIYSMSETAHKLNSKIFAVNMLKADDSNASASELKVQSQTQNKKDASNQKMGQCSLLFDQSYLSPSQRSFLMRSYQNSMDYRSNQSKNFNVIHASQIQISEKIMLSIANKALKHQAKYHGLDQQFLNTQDVILNDNSQKFENIHSEYSKNFPLPSLQLEQSYQKITSFSSFIQNYKLQEEQEEWQFLAYLSLISKLVSPYEDLDFENRSSENDLPAYLALSAKQLEQIVVDSIRLSKNRRAVYLKGLFSRTYSFGKYNTRTLVNTGFSLESIILSSLQLNFTFFIPTSDVEFHRLKSSSHSFIGHDMLHYNLISFKASRDLISIYGSDSLPYQEQYMNEAPKFFAYLMSMAKDEREKRLLHLITHYHIFEQGHILHSQSILKPSYSFDDLWLSFTRGNFGSKQDKEDFRLEEMQNQYIKWKAKAKKYKA